jgi:serine/threonine protein kinase
VSRWEDKWEIVQSLPGGGQGDTWLVKARGTKSPVHFLKVLRENRQERRERMRREIACYETLDHPRIPRLVDSNVIVFDQPGVIPYLVSEYVGGQHLEDYVIQRGYLRPAEAFEITLQLLDAVAYAHSHETVHRDIKPTNIVLRDNESSAPVLVDFGMSFYEGEDRLTPRSQEVGNRFLRLPEFSASSTNKRDPRSDVTLVAGILFYMLTGINPRNLRDEHGAGPHQTPVARTALARHSDIDLPRLLDVFDRAFDQVIHARFDSADAFSAALKTIRVGGPAMDREETAEEMIERLKELMRGHEEKRLQARRAQLEQAFKMLWAAICSLANEIPGLHTTQGGFSVDPVSGRAAGMAGLVRASNSKGYAPTYLIEIQGTELVFSLDDTALYRMPLKEFGADTSGIISKARSAYLMGLRNLPDEM